MTQMLIRTRRMKRKEKYEAREEERKNRRRHKLIFTGIVLICMAGLLGVAG